MYYYRYVLFMSEYPHKSNCHFFRYLELEWEAKCKTRREFSKSTMVDFCPRVPKQDNSSDCGVYLLQYVETFFQVQNI